MPNTSQIHLQGVVIITRRFYFQKNQDGTLAPELATLLGSIQEHNWLYPDEPISILFSNPDELCTMELEENDVPVGSIEFVEMALSKICKQAAKPLSPICIPPKLTSYAGRRIDIVPAGTDLYQFLTSAPKQRIFLKSATRLKCDFADIYSLNRPLPKDSLFFVSDVLDILSEWRIFVYKGEIQDVRCYSGDFWLMPNRHMVQDMVMAYTDSPDAYTLDVAVTSHNVTVPLEVHNFVCCGLYGFSGKNLIRMHEAGIRWEQQKLLPPKGVI